MFVGFIGAPGSGKTTVAAKVFAEFKQMGLPDVEFIAEEARRYIAGHQPDPIKDSDQENIFRLQRGAERIMSDCTGERGIVISDSCALNSLWYMTPEFRAKFLPDQDEYLNWLDENALLFVCSTVGIPSTKDTLRIHSPDASAKVEATMSKLLSVPPLDSLSTTLLVGAINTKVNRVVESVFGRLTH